MSSRAETVTCTPHFKQDADRAWVTQEGAGILSLWMNPNSDMTLEDIAKLIEQFGEKQVADQLAAQPSSRLVNVNFTNSIHNATIRGETFQRAQFVNYHAKEYLHDGEPFNLLYAFATTVPVWLYLCPCCILCSKSSQPSQPPDQQHMDRI